MGKKRLGAMIDLSRNGVMKPERVKDFANVLKKMRYDTLYLYMEDVYQIDGEPFFGHQRGRYTKEELKSIDDYCYSIGIEVIPCIQTLAHLDRMFKWDAYLDVRDMDNVLLVGEPRTYELIEKMVKTMHECFRTENLNVGLDEARRLGRGNYLDKHGYVESFKIMNEHLSKILKITDKYGFKVSMWGDMFFRKVLDGGYYVEKLDEKIVDGLKEVKNYVPKNVKLFYWDYCGTTKKWYDTNVKAHKILSDNIGFAGGMWSERGFAPYNIRGIKNTKSALLSMQENGVTDVMLTIWGDDGRECSPFACLPALFYSAEAFYGNYDLKDIKEKFYQTFGIKFDTYMTADLVNMPFTKDTEALAKESLYNDPFVGRMDSGLPVEYASNYKKYTRKLAYASKHTGEYGYIFECYKNLSSVLELKFDLSIRTRKAYLENNKEELKLIAYKTYPELLKRTDKFYNSMRTVWYTDNKPQGFEVQDIRIGGLKQRLSNCMNVLRDYLDGKVQSIPELEMPVLEYKNVWYHSLIATANDLSDLWK